MDKEFEDEQLRKFSEEYRNFVQANELFYEQCIADPSRCHKCTLRSLVEQSFSWTTIIRDVQTIRYGTMHLEHMVIEFLICTFYYRYAQVNPDIIQKHGTLLFQSLQMNAKNPQVHVFKVFISMINLFVVELFEKILDKIVENVYNTKPDMSQVHSLVNLYLEPLLKYCYSYQHEFNETTRKGIIKIQKISQDTNFVEDKVLEFNYSM